MSVREYLATLHGDVIVSTPDVTLIVEAYIAWIILDCKGRPVNAVNLELMTQVETILQTIDELITNDKIQLLVITSGKKNTFVAGADIHAMYPVTDEKAAADASRAGQNIFNRIESLRIPTLAAVNGPCLGAGLELALACTYRVAATGRHVQLGLPEVKLGLLPGAGGTVRLPRVVGLSRALEIILPGGSVPSTKALKYGIVDRVIDGEDHLPHEHRFYTGVRSYAISLFGKSSKRGSSTIKNDRGFKEKILDETRFGQYVVARTAAQNLDKQAKGKYPAPYVALDTVMQNINLNVKQGLEVEAKSFGRLSVTPQCKALMSLFFMTTDTKQQKVSAKPIKIKKIGVIGAGVMGAQIAAIAASKNIPVYIRDITPELVSKGLKHVEDTFMARVKKGRLPESKARQYISLVTGGTDVSGFTSCQLLIEAAVERMDLKKRILTEIESICPSDTIFATNTSSLSITELATVSKNPGNVVGLHFFNPVNKMPLVEVIRGTHTSDVAVATSYQLALQLGKFPVVCGDCPGFVVNRILGIYMNEAGILAMEGASLTEVDAALLSFGMPMGPFRLMDEVGLDVAAHVGPILEQGLGKRYTQIPSFAKLLHDNPKTLGKKTGAGFYTYTGEKQGPLNPQLLDQLTRLIKPAKHVATQKDMIDRCVLLMLNEAAMILDEKMVATPAELDLAMVMGTGFAPFTGGLLSYADARGIDVIVTRLQELEKKLGMRFHPAPLLVKKAEALKAGDRTAGRFFPERPDPKQLRPITSLPRSKL